MYLPIKLKGLGDVRLYVQPDADDIDHKRFLLVPENTNDPYLILELQDNSLAIIDHKIDIEEDEDILKERLDALALDIIEAMQQGKDLTEKDYAEENPYDPDKIRVDTKTFSLRQIYDMIKSGDINLSPDFQRHLVWDNYRKSRLIESILLRIPLPMFYFSQDEEGVLSVVDGLQRLTAIREFMDNEYSLSDLEYLERCEGKFYSKENGKIEDRYIRWFNMTQITANIVDPQSPLKVKYDIFRRINTGGKPLNAQELRNCLANNDLRRVLREMVNNTSFYTTTGKSVFDTRMEAQELALRFIYFFRLFSTNRLEDYNGSIDTELDKLVDTLSRESYEQMKDYVNFYDRAMQNAYYLFSKHAFRKVKQETTVHSGRSQINKALFVSWAVLLSQYDPEIIKCKNTANSFIALLGERISTDFDFHTYISYGTNGRNNILAAFQAAKDIIDVNLQV